MGKTSISLIVLILAAYLVNAQVYQWNSINGKYGLKSKKGKVLLEARYDYIRVKDIGNHSYVTAENNDVEDLYFVKGSKIKPMATALTNIDYEFNNQFDNPFFVLSTEGQVFITDFKGNVLFEVNTVSEDAYLNYSYNRYFEFVIEKENIELYGAFDKEMNLLVPAEYEELELEEDQLFIGEKNTDQDLVTYHIYNVQGDLLLETEAENLDVYEEDALYLEAELNGQQKQALVSENGDVVLPFGNYRFDHKTQSLVNVDNQKTYTNVEQWYPFVLENGDYGYGEVEYNILWFADERGFYHTYHFGTRQWFENRDYDYQKITKNYFALSDNDSTFIYNTVTGNLLVSENTDKQIFYANGFFTINQKGKIEKIINLKGREVDEGIQQKDGFHWTCSYYISEQEEDTYTLRDENGEKIMENEFYDYSILPELGFFMTSTTDEKNYLVDFEGNLHDDIWTYDLYDLEDFIDERPDANFLFVQNNDQFHLYDYRFEKLGSYDYFEPYSELDVFTVVKDGKTGFVNLDGKLIIPTAYNFNGELDDYLHYLILATPDQEETVIYDISDFTKFIRVDKLYYDFEWMFMEGEVSFAIAQKDGKWGVFDEQFNWIQKPELKEVKFDEYDYLIEIVKTIDGLDYKAYIFLDGTPLTKYFRKGRDQVLWQWGDETEIYTYTYEDENNSTVYGLVNDEINIELDQYFDGAYLCAGNYVVLNSAVAYLLYDIKKGEFVKTPSVIEDFSHVEYLPKVQLADGKWYYYKKGEFVAAD